MYLKKISTANPQLITLILDDSSSMQQYLTGTTEARYIWVERYSAKIMEELIARSTSVGSRKVTIKPRYYFDVIIYGSQAKPLNKEMLSIGDFALNHKEGGNSFGLGGIQGGTNAEAAFKLALERINTALLREEFTSSFPPMVFHLTDGESATDASAAAKKIKTLKTDDGHVLIVNAYIGAQTNLEYDDEKNFPGYVDTTEVGTNKHNLRLFNMSSDLPETIHTNLRLDNIFPAMRMGSKLFFDVRTKEMLRYVLQVVGSGGTQKRAAPVIQETRNIEENITDSDFLTE